MQNVTFTMSQNEASGLINLLGQLPTNSGVFPMLVMMVEQYKKQTEELQQEETPAA